MKFSTNPFKRSSSFNYSTYLSPHVRPFKESFFLNESQYCWQQQWRNLGGSYPLPSPCLVISFVNLITALSRRLPSLKEQCSPSLHSSLHHLNNDFHLWGICTCRWEGTFYSAAVNHGWLGGGRLCVIFNKVKVLSECVYTSVIREMWVESPGECVFAVSAEVKNKKSQQL